jgi:hypothetical protein
VVFPNVQPPPMATQLQNLGGFSAIVVGAFCEHNDQVRSLVGLLAAKQPRRTPRTVETAGDEVEVPERTRGVGDGVGAAEEVEDAHWRVQSGVLGGRKSCKVQRGYHWYAHQN